MSGGKIFGIGLFLGVILGLLLAILTAWKIGGYQLAEIFSKPTQSASVPAPTPTTEPDFLSLLPEGIAPAPAPTNVQPKDRPTGAVVAVPENSGPTVSTAIQQMPKQREKADATQGTYWLQVGSFTKQADAENRRGELALSGFEAGVQRVDVSGVGIRYRVRIGPFPNPEVTTRAKMELDRMNYEAAIVQQ